MPRHDEWNRRHDEYEGAMTTLTIGQLAKRVGLRTSALRYYEEQGLLTPIGRTESGYRLYVPEAEQTLRFIQRAQRLGFSLADIRVLLGDQQNGDLSDETAIEVAEERYLALERQVTRLLVLQHELGLFLHEMHPGAARRADTPAEPLFNRLLDHTCVNPLNRPAETMLDWLVAYTGCSLNTAEGQRLLDGLRGQHVHIWQEEDGYYVSVEAIRDAVNRHFYFNVIHIETGIKIDFCVAGHDPIHVWAFKHRR